MLKAGFGETQDDRMPWSSRNGNEGFDEIGLVRWLMSPSRETQIDIMSATQPAQSLASGGEEVFGFETVTDGVSQRLRRGRLHDIAKQIAVKVTAGAGHADAVERVEDRIDPAKSVECTLLNGAHCQYSSGRISVRTRTQSLSDAGSAAAVRERS
ncbi:hypothetical protein HMPREF0185_02753 [Brevundimonas diminuta 470-4]|nr:hypothetical protein HMPREF0185_02753 [Brevundimonas diminuta 470-4]